jgi:hypothetical protein
MPVKVISCTNSGGVSRIGFVDIRPLVTQLDGDGNVISHGTIHNVPYLRIQGGSNAVILDPQAGDVGIASFCDRDISGVKNIGAETAPGSRRKFDMSDAIYHSSIIGATPTQYVQFNSSGIVVKSPTNVTIDAPSADFTGTVSAVGTITSQADIIDHGTKSMAAMRTVFNSHPHTDPQGGLVSVPPILM